MSSDTQELCPQVVTKLLASLETRVKALEELAQQNHEALDPPQLEEEVPPHTVVSKVLTSTLPEMGTPLHVRWAYGGTPRAVNLSFLVHVSADLVEVQNDVAVRLLDVSTNAGHAVVVHAERNAVTAMVYGVGRVEVPLSIRPGNTYWVHITVADYGVQLDAWGAASKNRSRARLLENVSTPLLPEESCDLRLVFGLSALPEWRVGEFSATVTP